MRFFFFGFLFRFKRRAKESVFSGAWRCVTSIESRRREATWCHQLQVSNFRRTILLLHFDAASKHWDPTTQWLSVNQNNGIVRYTAAKIIESDNLMIIYSLICFPVARFRVMASLSYQKLLDHTQDTPQSVGLLWTGDQPDAETSTWQHTALTQTDIRAYSGIRTHNLSKRAAAEGRLRSRGHWDRFIIYCLHKIHYWKTWTHAVT